jgi:hypothetical protein
MQVNTKLSILGLTTLVAIAGLIAWSVRPRINLGTDVKPIPKNAPTLDTVDIEKILGVKQFRVIRHISQVPQVVKESFSNFADIPFDLADPGERISDDVVVPGMSSRRLVFLGVSDDSAVIYYEQGGIVRSLNVVVFWFGDGGRGWGAVLEHEPSPNDLSGMRAVIQSGQFQAWKGRR